MPCRELYEKLVVNASCKETGLCDHFLSMAACKTSVFAGSHRSRQDSAGTAQQAQRSTARGRATTGRQLLRGAVLASTHCCSVSMPSRASLHSPPNCRMKIRACTCGACTGSGTWGVGLGWRGEGLGGNGVGLSWACLGWSGGGGGVGWAYKHVCTPTHTVAYLVNQARHVGHDAQELLGRGELGKGAAVHLQGLCFVHRWGDLQTAEQGSIP